jgi:pimeloyl-ACP methyl ester carboxylesterase
MIPTLILVGEHDVITPPTAAKAMHENIKDSKMQIISSAAHMSGMENPTEFNEHLIKFLKGIST